MTSLRRCLRRILAFLTPGSAEDELAREIAAHRELFEEDLRRQGLDARRRPRRRQPRLRRRRGGEGRAARRPIVRLAGGRAARRALRGPDARARHRLHDGHRADARTGHRGGDGRVQPRERRRPAAARLRGSRCAGAAVRDGEARGRGSRLGIVPQLPRLAERQPRVRVDGRVPVPAGDDGRRQAAGGRRRARSDRSAVRRAARAAGAGANVRPGRGPAGPSARGGDQPCALAAAVRGRPRGHRAEPGRRRRRPHDRRRDAARHSRFRPRCRARTWCRSISGSRCARTISSTAAATTSGRSRG